MTLTDIVPAQRPPEGSITVVDGRDGRYRSVVIDKQLLSSKQAGTMLLGVLKAGWDGDVPAN
jgi:hypothetical protein